VTLLVRGWGWVTLLVRGWGWVTLLVRGWVTLLVRAMLLLGIEH
jgi:hypothetical protein